MPFSLQRNDLIMEKLDVYEIPLTVKAQVIKSNRIRKKLRWGNFVLQKEVYDLQLTCFSCFQWATGKGFELWQLQREVLSTSSPGRTTNAEGYQKLWYERSCFSTGKRRQTLSDLRGGWMFFSQSRTHALSKAFFVSRNNTDADISNFSSFIFHLFLKYYFLSATLLSRKPLGSGVEFSSRIRGI